MFEAAVHKVSDYLILDASQPLRFYSTTLLFAAIAVVFYWAHATGLNFQFGLSHIALNRLPGDKPSSKPTTEWLNMGYWKDTKIFPRACEALALKTILATRLREGSRVLDVGYGTGDSLLLYLSHPSIPRPSVLSGVTYVPVQNNRAQERITQLYSSSNEKMPSVDLHAGDALFRNQINHPLDPSSPTQFEVITAIDCAWHFNTREIFLRQCFSKLSPGGRLALADTCFEIDNAVLRFIAWLIKVSPSYNMVTRSEYRAQMETIGYSQIVIEDVTDDVFPGLISFLRNRKELQWWIYVVVFSVWKFMGARYVIASGSKP